MKVLLEINVPEGKYCWNFHDRLCGYFDNEGGWAKCEFGWTISETDNGIEKSPECLRLSKVKETK